MLDYKDEKIGKEDMGENLQGVKAALSYQATYCGK